MTPTMTLDLMGMISLVVGIASLVLAVVAIWISLHFKQESDKVNQRTLDVLVEIKSDAKVAAQLMGSEVTKWGDTARQVLMVPRQMSASQADVTTKTGIGE